LILKASILRLAQGLAFLAVEIARNFPEVEITAVELSSYIVTVGRKYVAENRLDNRIKFVVGDAEDEKLLHSLGEFDLVYSAYSLHHWVNPNNAIVNLYRAVQTGGMFYIFDLMRAWWLYWIPIKNGFSIQSEHHICQMRLN
jgi:ubiquinone/menaquinone biosynthesis C-methylase UbiE